MSDAETGSALAFAVILHRLPVGISIWWLVSRNVGPVSALLAIAVLMAATGGGYAAGALANQLPSLHPWLVLFQALVAGVLVHVALDRSPLYATDHVHEA